MSVGNVIASISFQLQIFKLPICALTRRPRHTRHSRLWRPPWPPATESWASSWRPSSRWPWRRPPAPRAYSPADTGPPQTRSPHSRSRCSCPARCTGFVTRCLNHRCEVASFFVVVKINYHIIKENRGKHIKRNWIVLSRFYGILLFLLLLLR